MTKTGERMTKMRGRLALTAASQRLAMSYNQTHRLALIGTLPAEKVDGHWYVDAEAVERLKHDRESSSA